MLILKSIFFCNRNLYVADSTHLFFNVVYCQVDSHGSSRRLFPFFGFGFQAKLATDKIQIKTISDFQNHKKQPKVLRWTFAQNTLPSKGVIVSSLAYIICEVSVESSQKVANAWKAVSNGSNKLFCKIIKSIFQKFQSRPFG